MNTSRHLLIGLTLALPLVILSGESHTEKYGNITRTETLETSNGCSQVLFKELTRHKAKPYWVHTWCDIHNLTNETAYYALATVDDKAEHILSTLKDPCTRFRELKKRWNEAKTIAQTNDNECITQ